MTDGPVGEGVVKNGTVRLTMPARAEYLILAFYRIVQRLADRAAEAQAAS